MKKSILLTLFIVSLLSCKLSEEEKQAMLPQSTGNLAEVVVVIDSEGLDSITEGQIRSVFGKPIVGIHPEEPQFKVMLVKDRYFDGFFRNHHNIFILLHRNNMDKMQELYGLQNLGKIDDVIRNKSTLGFGRSNIWARNQSLFFITGSNKQEVLEKMASRSDEIRDIASANEKRTGKKNIYSESKKKDVFYNNSLKEKGYAVRKPNSYRVAIDDSTFTWLRKETSKFDYGIFIYETPYTIENQWELDSLMAVRTSFLRVYVPGETPGSYMGISSRFPPSIRDVEIDKKYAKEVRGWWSMVGEFMGGPFISYSVHDKVNNRIITAEGFVYGPNKDKARHMREVELIVNTLKIND